MTTTVTIIDRRRANPDKPADLMQIATFTDPANPGAQYLTAPYLPGGAAEANAVQAAVAWRKAAGLDYPGKVPAAPAPADTVTLP